VNRATATSLDFEASKYIRRLVFGSGSGGWRGRAVNDAWDLDDLELVGEGEGEGDLSILKVDLRGEGNREAYGVSGFEDLCSDCGG
jgi:hypothetical protein